MYAGLHPSMCHSSRRNEHGDVRYTSLYSLMRESTQQQKDTHNAAQHGDIPYVNEHVHKLTGNTIQQDNVVSTTHKLHIQLARLDFGQLKLWQADASRTQLLAAHLGS
jgi:hypothetical protein